MDVTVRCGCDGAVWTWTWYGRGYRRVRYGRGYRCGCDGAVVWLFACVGVTVCGCVVVWLRGSVAVWLCGCVAACVAGRFVDWLQLRCVGYCKGSGHSVGGTYAHGA